MLSYADNLVKDWVGAGGQLTFEQHSEPLSNIQYHNGIFPHFQELEIRSTFSSTSLVAHFGGWL